MAKTWDELTIAQKQEYFDALKQLAQEVPLKDQNDQTPQVQCETRQP